MTDVVSLGSVNIDRIRPVDAADLRSLEADADWLPAPGETRVVPSLPEEALTAATETALGGKGANQAVAASLAGAATTLLGGVGTDQYDVALLESLRRAGVDVGGVAVRDRPTGTALILVEDDGENRIALRAGANATVDPVYVHDHARRIAAADCLLVQNEVPVAATLAALDVVGDTRDPPTVVLDPAPAGGAGPLVTADPVDVITPNADEARRLADRLHDTTATVITTHGPDPVEIAGTEHRSVPPPSVNPVDTTAAGDVFAGYLAAGIAESGSWETSLERAIAAASLSTQTAGAQPSIPDNDAVGRFLDRVGPLQTGSP